MSGYLAKHGYGSCILRFDYDADDVAAVKARLPGARWSKEDRGWVLSEDDVGAAAKFATNMGWDVLDDAIEILTEILERGNAAVARAHERMEAAGERLYPKQPPGVEFLSTHRQALLAWDQRTGKTVVSAITPEPDAPILLQCPGAIKHQWEEELHRFRPEYDVTVLSGRGSFRWPGYREAVIYNYEIAPPANKTNAGWIRAYPGANPGTVFMVDEAHLAKNPKTLRAQSTKSVRMGVDEEGGWTWFLTATPFSNSPIELWNLLQCLGVAKSTFGSFPRFMDLFQAKRVHGQIVWGQPRPEVKRYLSKVMHRLSIRDAMGGMPPFLDSYLPVDVTAKPDERLRWDRDFERWRDAVNQGANAAVLEDILGATRMSLAQAKIPPLLKLVEDYEREGVPVVVFSAHRAPIEALAKREGWAAIIGQTTAAQKNEAKRAFQAGKLKGIGLTIRAGSLGLSLYRAKEMIGVDLDWSPAENAQVMMRCVHTKQDEPVRIRILTAAGTADVEVLKDQERKLRAVRGTLYETLEPPPKRSLEAESTPPPRRKV